MANKEQFKAAVITVSDRCYKKEKEDISGKVITKILTANGYIADFYKVIPDEKELIEKLLVDLADNQRYNLIITTGGTGCAKRDVTPEATQDIAEKIVPGISEAIRAQSLLTTKHAMLSRGICVIRKESLIINLPGSPKACDESMNVIIEALPHALGLMRGEKLDA